MTNKTIIRIGNNFSFLDGEAIKVIPELSPGVYEVEYNREQDKYSLNYVRPTLNVPAKIYGKTNERLEKIIRAWQNKDSSMGVLMSGDAGSGKTVLAKMVANEVIRMGHPVIMVSQKANPKNPSFAVFLRDIKGRVMVLFDEFEKMFEKVEEQSSLLALMDGTDSVEPKLFILTANSVERINPYLLGRPGRIRYHFDYSFSDDDVIRAYCDEKGVNATDTNDIIIYSRTVGSVNFDSLVSIVEEIDMTGLSFRDVMEDLNLPVMSSTGLTFSFRLVHGKTSVPNDGKAEPAYDKKTFYLCFKKGISQLPEEEQEAFWEAVDKDGDISVNVSPKNMTGYDKNTGEMVFSTQSPHVHLHLSKKRAENGFANIFAT